MMQKAAFFTGTLASLLLAFPATVVADTPLQESVVVWETDFSGHPPFKRVMKRLPVEDMAALETTAESVESKAAASDAKKPGAGTEPVWKAKFRGHPPFKRRLQELSVVDLASMELQGSGGGQQEAQQTVRRTRTSFKRHP